MKSFITFLSLFLVVSVAPAADCDVGKLKKKIYVVVEGEQAFNTIKSLMANNSRYTVDVQRVGHTTTTIYTPVVRVEPIYIYGETVQIDGKLDVSRLKIEISGGTERVIERSTLRVTLDREPSIDFIERYMGRHPAIHAVRLPENGSSRVFTIEYLYGDPRNSAIQLFGKIKYCEGFLTAASVDLIVQLNESVIVTGL